jgi:hypothetical protein
MFSWLRDKTTTSYNPIHDGESSIITDPRVHTTSAVPHQKQKNPNGRDVFSIFNDLHRSIAF